MINLEQKYTPRINPGDADYPFGSIKGDSSPGAGDGTPLSSSWGNDIEGFRQAVMTEAGITPSGLPDTAHTSQLWSAMKDILRQEVPNMGWTPVEGSFELGGTITASNQILWWEAAKSWYSWQGTIPLDGYVVAADSTPATTGGVSTTAWVDRTDGALRTELADDDGAALIGGMTYASLRAYDGAASSVYVLGRANVFDKAHGYFDRVATVLDDNDGAVIVDSLGRSWKRRFTGALRLEWFASNETDASPGLVNAHLALPSWGGTIEATSLFYIGSPVVFTKRCNIVGDGAAEADVNSGTLFKKLAGCNGDAITFTGGNSGAHNLTVSGLPGNVGAGVTLLGNRPNCENLSVYGCGSDGVRIGADGNGYNQNGWRLRNIKAKFNGRWGVHISDKVSTTPNAPDCNSGMLDGADLQYNSSHGIHLGAAQYNTFINVMSQTNTGRGISLSQYSIGNLFFGGDSESNGEDEILCATGSQLNTFIGMSVNGTITDSGSSNSFMNIGGDNNRFLGLKLPNVASTEPKVLDWYEEKDISSNIIVNFSVPGDSVFTVTDKVVTTQRVGNRIHVDFNITALVDFSTAGGVLRLSGLGTPASAAIATRVFTGSLNARGINTSRPVVCPKINAGGSQIAFTASGPGVAFESIGPSNITSASTLQLEGSISYTC